jgi:hypothetical protein
MAHKERIKMRLFDRTKLRLKHLSSRRHELSISVVKSLRDTAPSELKKKMQPVARRIRRTRDKRASIIFMMGGHVIRAGVQRYIIDLMKKGFISCIAMNGSGMIHDFEFSLIGATTESVARYIKEGQFGLWKETSMLNEIINNAYKKNEKVGMGEAVGSYIEGSKMPYKSISILANAYRFKIPLTIHVGIGYDIIHQHPNCDGRATGALSYNDFLIFTSIVEHLENGVIMDFGSSVMAPEVFLKALSMARNVAHQKNRKIKHFTALVCDLIDLPEEIHKEPSKLEPEYYFRPWKTILVRTVSDGGKSFYIKGRHEETIPALWADLNGKDN